MRLFQRRLQIAPVVTPRQNAIRQLESMIREAAEQGDYQRVAILQRRLNALREL